MTTLTHTPSADPGVLLQRSNQAVHPTTQSDVARESTPRPGPAAWDEALLHHVADHATDAGVGRTHNEDCILSRPELGLFAVADGMGGFNAGEVASRLVIETIERRLSNVDPQLDRQSLESLICSVINEANAAVLRTSARRPECLGMGTTLSLLWVRPVGILMAHVGDSRVYSYKHGLLNQVSRDHVINVLPEALHERMNEFGGARKGILTRAIGAEQTVEADVLWMEAAPKARYLICSDGLSDALSLSEIETVMCDAHDHVAQCLVDGALDHGAADNVSALVLSI